jgi:hypothetical protein
MQRLVQFIDTSVFVEILDVPGKASQHGKMVRELRQRASKGIKLVLPTAAVIEAGNHVCQVQNGHHRRECATRFDRMLRLSAAGETPWVLHEATWDAALLSALCDGAGTGTTLVEHSVRQTLGVGDLSVLAERDRYLSRVARSVVKVEVWTTDQQLAGWSASR